MSIDYGVNIGYGVAIDMSEFADTEKRDWWDEEWIKWFKNKPTAFNEDIGVTVVGDFMGSEGLYVFFYVKGTEVCAEPSELAGDAYVLNDEIGDVVQARLRLISKHFKADPAAWHVIFSVS